MATPRVKQVGSANVIAVVVPAVVRGIYWTQSIRVRGVLEDICCTTSARVDRCHLLSTYSKFTTMNTDE